MKEKENAELIENFAFDNDETFKDFMDVDDETPPTKLGAKPTQKDPVFDEEEEEEEKPPTKIDEKKVVAKAKPKPQEEKEEEEYDFDFNEQAKGETTKPKQKEEKEEEGDVLGEDFYKNLALDLKERGTLQAVEIPEDKELTADDFIDLQEAEIEARTQEAIEAFAEGMDQDAKDFLRFVKNGGRTSDFVRHYLAPSFNLKEFDEDNKTHVSATIDYYLRTVEGLEGEDLVDRKEWLKNGGKEVSHAKTYFAKIQKADERRKLAVQAQMEAQAREEQEEAQAFNEALVDSIQTIKAVGDFTISDSDRKALPAYMTKPTVKVGKNRYVPQFHAELGKTLRAATAKDRERYILLAKLFASDFKLPNLKQSLETQVTKEAKLRIQKSSPKGTTGSSARKRSLADLFDES